MCHSPSKSRRFRILNGRRVLSVLPNSALIACGSEDASLQIPAHRNFHAVAYVETTAGHFPTTKAGLLGLG